MFDFDRLFELLEKADNAADCSCKPTTLAYLGLVQQEVFRLANLTETSLERRRFLGAARYVERKMLGLKFEEAARFSWAFWRGFENGWNEHTQPLPTALDP
jgi:hypothetical protein